MEEARKEFLASQIAELARDVDDVSLLELVYTMLARNRAHSPCTAAS